MLEQKVEAHLVKRMKEIGGECYKWSSPGNRGVPDRICIFPNGIIVFVELKKPRKEPTKLQALVGRRLQELYQSWTWANTIERVDSIVESHL